MKMQALIIGGLFGALGGIIYVLPSTVQADSMGRSLTFFAYTALLLGGAATIFGPVLGAVLFYGGRVLIRETANAYVPSSIMSDTADRDLLADRGRRRADAAGHLPTTRHPG